MGQVFLVPDEAINLEKKNDPFANNKNYESDMSLEKLRLSLFIELHFFCV